MLGLDYSSLTAAGAFILGAVLGTLATIRLTKALIDLAARALNKLTPPSNGRAPRNYDGRHVGEPTDQTDEPDPR